MTELSYTLTGTISLADKAADDYLLLPFEVPPGLSRLTVSYEYSKAVSAALPAGSGNVVDIGVFDPRGAAVFQGQGFRGWSGSDRSDYAIMGHFGGSILETGQGLRGWEQFMIDLARGGSFLQAFLEKLTEFHLANLARYLDAVGPYIQIIVMGDDLGTQHGPQISPQTYRRWIKPCHTRIYGYVRQHYPQVYVFLHSCGGIYPLIPDLIEAGVQILNPVQISAAGMDPVRLKQEFGADLAFWGGGCDTQHTLPRGTPQEVTDEVTRLLDIFALGGGYVFNQVHNIQADVPPENIVAMLENGMALKVVQKIVYPLRDLGVFARNVGTLKDISIFGQQNRASDQTEPTVQGCIQDAGRCPSSHDRAADQDVGVNHHAQRAGLPEPQPPPEPHQP